MRRWRFVLLVLALVSVIGIGAVATHGALDAPELAAAAQDHAESCLLVSLVCALVVATVASLRTVVPASARRVAARAGRTWQRRSWQLAIAYARGPSPSPARLCRFLT